VVWEQVGNLLYGEDWTQVENLRYGGFVEQVSNLFIERDVRRLAARRDQAAEGRPRGRSR
jgi:hypothetical protein